ncbi:extracellular solute-binding protein [Vaccinium witches'-broom phytoplasma]|uniref:extracellular solute-binding protein n=1 Tax=Vaccinium witches'-broom phytoplasma TaxID=85642 RepID=UPI00037215CB|nr:extracellular solute-binding protein [Vaccinium witches'-broom phytoplasma]
MNKKKYLLRIGLLMVFFSIFYLAYKIMRKDSYSHPEKQTIILFNWGEFIEPSLITEFNKQSTNYVIKQSFFSSNELAVNKIKSGDKYDIAILSEYAIEKLNKEDPNLLERIYYDKIDKFKGKKEIGELTKKFKGVYDNKLPQNIKPYTIPYFWGNLGLLYNKERINKDEIQNWKNSMMNPEKKISLYNNSFEGIFIGLKATDGNIQNPTSDQIIKAKEWLLDLKNTNNKLSFVTDQLLDQMKIQGEEKYDISLTYSGDARFLMKQNKNLDFYPFDEGDEKERGTNIWVDSIVLPKNANTKGAYEFINFLLDKKNISKNAEFIGYDSPYKETKNGELQIEIKDGDQMYQYNKEIKKEINDSWNEIYAHPRPQDNYLLFINLFIISLLLLFRFIKYFRKK